MSRSMTSYGKPAGASHAPRADARPITTAAVNENRLGYAFFILLNIFLFLRPSEVFPALAGWRFYEIAQLACVVCYRTELLSLLSRAALFRSPITVCVLGIILASIASMALNGDRGETIAVANDSLNFVLYFLLMLAAIHSPGRLKHYLLLLTTLLIIVTVAGLGQYYKLWDVSAPPYHELQDYRDASGNQVYLDRLCSYGIFDNPNDLSRSIVVGVLLCLWRVTDQQPGPRRFLWLIPSFMFIFALQLTYSRGGFLALVAGVAMMLYRRFGRTRSLIIGALLAPIMLAAFAGRLTNIDTSGGTGQERIRLWRDAFEELQSCPVLGMGVGKFSEKVGLVAHNSFVQAYVETGIIGGSLFAAAFYLAVWGPSRASHNLGKIRNRELRRLYPFLLAILAASIVGMFSSTRNLRVDTYLLLGLSAVFMRLLLDQSRKAIVPMNLRLCGRIAVVGLLVLVAFNAYVRLAAT